MVRCIQGKARACAFEIEDEFSEPGYPWKTMLVEGSLFLAKGNRARRGPLASMGPRSDNRGYLTGGNPGPMRLSS
jgi:hypothetical protein